jgi:integrase
VLYWLWFVIGSYFLEGGLVMSRNNHFFLKDFTKLGTSHSLSDKSISTLIDSKSESTIDSYESDWNDFCDWCTYHKQQSFPASPETVVNYINDLADYAKISTIRRRISAISENYNAANPPVPNPCREWIVREALTGLSRHKGAAQKGKTPIYWEEIQRIVSDLDPKNIRDIRDKAVLLVGFMGAFRRSEISGLDVEDLAFYPQGMVITIRQSKTDQSGEGQQVGIPYIKDKRMDAILAVKEWMKAGGITEGPLFRSILKSGKPSKKRLSDKSINLIVKSRMASIGADPDLYGAHSLRHGFATYAALHGVEERIIMKQTRHRSVEMVRHYINEANLFVNNPISLMFEKK